MLTWQTSENGKRHSTVINGKTIEIREATQQDNQKIGKLIETIDDDAFAKRFDKSQDRNTLRNSYASGKDSNSLMKGRKFIAIEENEKVVGMSDHERSLSFPDKTVATCGILVHQDYQGKKIGKKLVEVREDALRKEGFLYQTEVVHADNTPQIDRLIKSGSEKLLEPFQDDIGVTYWKALDPRYEGRDPGIALEADPTDVLFYPNVNGTSKVKTHEDDEFRDLNFAVSPESQEKIARNKSNLSTDDEGYEFFESKITVDPNRMLRVEPDALSR